MDRVFISMNADGDLVIKPSEEHKTELVAKASHDAKPQILDSRGRLKLPADVCRFLSGDDDQA